MSQKDAQKRTIGDHTYEVFMLAPMVSHGLLMDVMKMVGPSLGPVLDAVKSGGGGLSALMGADLSGEFFTKAAARLFGDLDKATLEELIKVMAGVTHVDGKPLDQIFDEHFRGDLGEMYMWLGFAMKAQWGKSLGALMTKVGGGQGAGLIATESPSQNT